MMFAGVFRFSFREHVPIEDAEMTLHLAMLAAEGLFGKPRVAMEFRYELHGFESFIDINGDSEVSVAVARIEDPESSPYDRYSPRLHKHSAALVSEWCDAVLFATRKIRTQSEDAGFNRKRTIAHAIGKGGGERILRCVGGRNSIPGAGTSRRSIPSQG